MRSHFSHPENLDLKVCLQQHVGDWLAQNTMNMPSIYYALAVEAQNLSIIEKGMIKFSLLLKNESFSQAKKVI
jgi:predicted XRE-type DNA-binding protein